MYYGIPLQLLPKEQRQTLLNKRLAKSIRNGNTVRALTLIDEGAEVDGFDPKTLVQPLVTAVTWNRLNLISELVARGAKIDASFSMHKGKKHLQLVFHGTPLQYAASKNNVGAVERMLWTIPQSLIRSLPKTPPEDIVEKHLAFITDVLTKEVLECRGKINEWSKARPIDHAVQASTSHCISKKKHARIIALLSPETIPNHKEHINANLNQNRPKIE